MTKVFLSRTNQVGSPWERRSVTSGSTRHRARRRSRGVRSDSAMLPDHSICTSNFDFHIMNYLVLNIPFVTIIGVYALFLAWDVLAGMNAFDVLVDPIGQVGAKVGHGMVPGLIAVAVSAGLQAFGSPVLQPIEWLAPGEEGVQQAVVCTLCAVVVAFCLWSMAAKHVSPPAVSLDAPATAAGSPGSV
jgi:hypothetical protein